ncbi:MAG: UDP-N-acetylmuramate dehydrogenase [Phycisphaeraceae bacterium]|nr:UDP-N-acetylmuramate dehydrogenase [Phycisphaeraceae bacterium]
MLVTDALAISRLDHVPTWFGIGGGAERFATVRNAGELNRAMEADPALRVLGDGANLLVDDDGVSELVVKMEGELADWVIDPVAGTVRVGAGANLPKLINETVRQGLAGLETLGGIPASVGGALVMNAGGKFGEIEQFVVRLHAISRDGREFTLERKDIAFGYRRSGLKDLVLTSCDLQLAPDDAGAVRKRLKEVMSYKKTSQPMAEKSAGCTYKNPTLEHDIMDLHDANGRAGRRVPAGLLIDRAGLKGLAVNAVSVSDVHANFFVTRPGATARDVISLMEQVERRVLDRFGVQLEREVVVWSRHGQGRQR